MPRHPEERGSGRASYRRQQSRNRRPESRAHGWLWKTRPTILRRGRAAAAARENDDTEDRGVRPDSQRERQNCRDGEGATLAQDPEWLVACVPVIEAA